MLQNNCFGSINIPALPLAPFRRAELKKAGYCASGQKKEPQARYLKLSPLKDGGDLLSHLPYEA